MASQPTRVQLLTTCVVRSSCVVYLARPRVYHRYFFDLQNIFRQEVLMTVNPSKKMKYSHPYHACLSAFLKSCHSFQKMGENTPGTSSEFRIVMEDPASSLLQEFRNPNKIFVTSLSSLPSLLQEVRNPPVPKSVCIPPSAHSPNAILPTLILTRNDYHFKSNYYLSAQKKNNSIIRTILGVRCYAPMMSHSPPQPNLTVQP